MLLHTLSSEAMVAIQEGISRKATIAELEYLGVSNRTINQIEDFHKIIYLADLIELSDYRIQKVPNLGEKGLASIKGALARYHELAMIMEKAENSTGSFRLDHYKKNFKRIEGNAPR